MEPLHTRNSTTPEPELLWQVGQEVPELLGASFDQSTRGFYLALAKRFGGRENSDTTRSSIDSLCNYSVALPVVAYREAVSADGTGVDLKLLVTCALEGTRGAPGRRAASVLLALGALSGSWTPGDIGGAFVAMGMEPSASFRNELNESRRELLLLTKLFQHALAAEGIPDLKEALREVMGEQDTYTRTCYLLELIVELSSTRELLFFSSEDAIDAYLPDPLDGGDKVAVAVWRIKG